MCSSKYRHAQNRLHISFPSFFNIFFLFQSNLEERMCPGGCVALTWSELYINIPVRGIFVSCFLKIITSCTYLVICLMCYVHVTSTKGYKNHTREPLIKKLNKQVYWLQKQSSFHIYLIGTGTDPCFRYWDGQEWQQSSPHSPKRYSLSHTLCKSKKNFLRCLTLSCDDVPSN